MGWTWYLSVDYQLYLMAPFLMVPIVRGWKRTGLTIAVVTSLSFVAAAGYISYRYKMAETLIQTSTSDGGLVNVYDVLNRLYYEPWCRVAPYITGLIMGHYFRVTECRIRVPKAVVVVGWILSTVVGLTMVFGMYESYSHHHLTTVLGAAIYNSLKDACFSLAVAWVIFACVTGNGGFVNTILSWKAFILISRVTYCMYLVHIPVLFYFSFAQEGAIWWTESYLVINWLGLLAVSAMIAVIISLTTEAPSLRAEKLILNKLGFTMF
ncbi:nose resistant to fluoxetine protein 6 [Plakobranchus ocellatus]|uniref:Nose resistant to fluoxetine protein 6 n=1 Tax=Plakobranchus ocellatus TaxID=259542 RepID=A0AAV4D6M2_9GAST|nr:nose resistant to fluoxetine protein 6 [Plakobranchus ocellatus]